jgi:chromosome segregation ATPase
MEQAIAAIAGGAFVGAAIVAWQVDKLRRRLDAMRAQYENLSLSYDEHVKRWAECDSRLEVHAARAVRLENRLDDMKVEHAHRATDLRNYTDRQVEPVESRLAALEARAARDLDKRNKAAGAATMLRHAGKQRKASNA